MSNNIFSPCYHINNKLSKKEALLDTLEQQVALLESAFLLEMMKAMILFNLKLSMPLFIASIDLVVEMGANLIELMSIREKLSQGRQAALESRIMLQAINEVK